MKHCYPCKECRTKMYRAAGKKGGQATRDKGMNYSAMGKLGAIAKHQSKEKEQS